ncbi:TraX family protein [Anaerorhabdus furcosa]|uniref:TraX protein n=1 Tax=Anaerorhabdus furcosa TaxID=118967 RepID=A0A1T4MJA8_9FIRM|nr:TraX family protein [Anaerorhabdus furcosa]SJZ66926.1 TraX protein [Anaerorhabdus furcosa]
MKFNSFQIKLFMMLLMVLDHLSIIPGLLPFELVAIFHFITRPVAIWFAFTLVEGFMHTHDRYNYCKRLFIFAGIMALGNLIIMLTINPDLLPNFPNIIFALAMCCLALILFFHDKGKITEIPPIFRISAGIAVLILCTLIGEGSFLIPMFVFIFYYNYNKPKQRDLWLIGVSIFMMLSTIGYVMSVNGTIYEMLYSEGCALLVIPFLHMYNGKPGKKTTFTQYLFYVFYPFHIWVIYTIAAFIK